MQQTNLLKILVAVVGAIFVLQIIILFRIPSLAKSEAVSGTPPAPATDDILAAKEQAITALEGEVKARDTIAFLLRKDRDRLAQAYRESQLNQQKIKAKNEAIKINIDTLNKSDLRREFASFGTD